MSVLEAGSAATAAATVEDALLAGVVSLQQTLVPSAHYFLLYGLTIALIYYGFKLALDKTGSINEVIADLIWLILWWGAGFAVIKYSGDIGSVVVRSGDYLANVLSGQGSNGDILSRAITGIFSPIVDVLDAIMKVKFSLGNIGALIGLFLAACIFVVVGLYVTIHVTILSIFANSLLAVMLVPMPLIASALIWPRFKDMFWHYLNALFFGLGLKITLAIILMLGIKVFEAASGLGGGAIVTADDSALVVNWKGLVLSLIIQVTMLQMVQHVFMITGMVFGGSGMGMSGNSGGRIQQMKSHASAAIAAAKKTFGS